MMKDRADEGMRLLTQGGQERLPEDVAFMLKIQVIPGRKSNTSKGVKVGKKSDVFQKRKEAGASKEYSKLVIRALSATLRVWIFFFFFSKMQSWLIRWCKIPDSSVSDLIILSFSITQMKKPGHRKIKLNNLFKFTQLISRVWMETQFQMNSDSVPLTLTSQDLQRASL